MRTASPNPRQRGAPGPRSLHVVVPGGHGVSGPEVQRLEAAFLEQGSLEGLDLTEVQALPLPPLVLADPATER